MELSSKGVISIFYLRKGGKLSKRKRLYILLGCLLGLVILVGVGPIIIGLIVRQEVEPTKQEVKLSEPEIDLTKSEKTQIMLMVTGEVNMIKDNGVSYIILTASSGKRYILTGPKAEELRDISNKMLTVVGIPRQPIPKEIKGELIRRTIEVKSVEIK